jgi:hypothetical protein
MFLRWYNMNMIVIVGEELVIAAVFGEYDDVMRLLSQGVNINYQQQVNN